MMVGWKTRCAGLAMLAALAPGARAQIPATGSPFSPPAIPGGAAPGLPGGVPAAPGGGPAIPAGYSLVPPKPQHTLLGFLGLGGGGLSSCLSKLCKTQLGQLLNNGAKPLGALTGGIVPSLCPPNAIAPGEAGPPGSAPGAQSVANKIQQDEANAKARVAAVEYLGTVDCHYWPDAATALVNSLRTDRNECVRFAAARVLGTGCCCNKRTIDALTLVVNCSATDGNPAETSPRVKAAAFLALQHCLMGYTGAAPAPAPIPLERPDAPARPELPDSPPRSPVPDVLQTTGGAPPPPDSYEARLDAKPMALVLADARRALARSVGTRSGPGQMVTGRRSVYHAMAYAAPPVGASESAKAPAPAAAARPQPRRAEAMAKVDSATRPAAYARPAATPPPPALATGQRGLFQILRSSLGSRDE